MQDMDTDTTSELAEAVRLANCKKKMSKGVYTHTHLCLRKGEGGGACVQEKAAKGQRAVGESGRKDCKEGALRRLRT